MSKNLKEERIGEVKSNYQNCLMEIIEYKNAHDITVQFKDDHGAKVHTEYNNFLRGRVKNPYYPSVYGRGYLGDKYPTFKEKHKKCKEYQLWQRMMERCYGSYYRHAYENAEVDKEWWNYDNFYEWLHQQPNFEMWYYKDDFALDKDILKKGNKTYSAENCCIVPRKINSLLIGQDRKRGHLKGVTKDKRRKQFIACKCNQYCDTEEEAAMYYKQYKENYIRQMAEKFYKSGEITKQCYQALLNYKIGF